MTHNRQTSHFVRNFRPILCDSAQSQQLPHRQTHCIQVPQMHFPAMLPHRQTHCIRVPSKHSPAIMPHLYTRCILFSNAAFWAATLESAPMLPSGQIRWNFAPMLPSGQPRWNPRQCCLLGRYAGISRQCCLLGRHAGIRVNAASWADTSHLFSNAAFWADKSQLFSNAAFWAECWRNPLFFFFQAIAWFIFQAFAWFISSVVLCLSAFHCRRAQNPTAKDAVTPGIQSTPKWHRQHQH